MNNALDIALTRIKMLIPSQIFDVLFAKKEVWEISSPIEDLILNRVIRTMVLKDANIFGGKEKPIVLRREYLEELEYTNDDIYMNTGRYSLYRIPASEREGQQLIEVHNVVYRGNYAGYVPNTNGLSGGANYLTLGQGVLDAHTFASSPPKPNIMLLSGDLVKLWPPQHSNIIWTMNCRIAYDENFTNLNTSALDTFADLCVEAVKMYAYNTLIIPLDKGYVESGLNIGEFKRIIDTYADSPVRYKELLSKLAGSMILDPSRLMNILPYLL